MIAILFLYESESRDSEVDIDGIRKRTVLGHGGSTNERMRGYAELEKVTEADPREEVGWYEITGDRCDPDADKAVKFLFSDDDQTTIISNHLMDISSIMGVELGRPLSYIILEC